MVMDAPSPQSVGREFVRQYYTLLNKAPLHLHRFYSGDSSFVHGGLDKDEEILEPVHGQQEIHQKIKQLNFRDCKAKIRQVDAHATLASGVVVQVLGELSNNNKPMRRFMQTFVLAPQAPKKYYVYNDIFRYQDEVFDDSDTDPSISMATDNMDNSFENVENEKNNHRNDGIATVSILDGVQKPSGGGGSEIHVNGGDPPILTPANDIVVAGGPILTQELSPKVQPIVVEAPVAPTVVSSAPEVVVAQPPQSVITQPPAPEFEEDAQEDEKEEVEIIAPAPAATTTTTTTTTNNEINSEAIEQTTTTGRSNPETSSETSEKPTYANLFKNTPGAGGPTRVPSGPISLPPAGFGPKPSQQTPSSTATSPPITKEGSPAAGFQGPNKSFRGQNNKNEGGAGSGGGGRSGANSNLGTGSGPTGGSGSAASSDRYRPSRDSVSSATGEDGGDRNRGPGRMNSLSSYPDSHQVFVGNLPHRCVESNLKDLFSKFGKVVDVRINNKGVAQSKNLPDGTKGVPNFGFVVFEDEKAAADCLSQKPIYLPDGHRLNVETKKKNNREDGRGGGFGGASGGSKFDRGSQEQLGGLGRGGTGNASRGNSRGGARGGGRGGFTGSRGSGPPTQGGPSTGNTTQQQRTTYTRKS